MSWFSKTPEPDEPPYVPPVRLASDEFVSALYQVRDRYVMRAARHRDAISNVAARIAASSRFNQGELDRMVGEIRDAAANAILLDGLATEIGDLINDYVSRGRRPPYMAEQQTQD